MQNTFQIGDREFARTRGGAEHHGASARASRLPSHCVASLPPFQSGRRLPRTNDVCRRTPAAAPYPKQRGFPPHTHRHVERGPRDRTRTDTAFWHGPHDPTGTATRPKPRVPVRVLAGRVTTLQSCEFCELRAGRCPTCPKPALVRTISLPRAEYARRRRAIDDRVAWWRCCSRSTSGARRFRGHIVQPAQRRAPRPELPRRLRRGSGASAPGCAAIRLYPRSVLHARAPRASGTEGCRSKARFRSMVPQIEF